MSHSAKLVNIDLTEDNADLLETLLQTPSPAKKPYLPKTTESDESAMSVIDTLRSLQRDNPQVETIFIDSDEEEENAVRTPVVHETQTITSPFSISTSGPPPLAFRSPRSSQTTPFRVREVLPSQLPLNVVENGNTIALQDLSKNSTSKRYLVIPKEVLPILAASKGPVALNVPGVGPLLITKPSEMLKSSNTQINLSVQMPRPLPIPDLNSSSVSEKKKPKIPETYDPLCDAKYQCWRYRKGIKRDLDGYSLTDRLGFYQAEQRRSRMCVMKCNDIMKKLQYSINMSKRKLANIQGSNFNMDNIKLVEIDKIKRGRKKRSPRKENKASPKLKRKDLSHVQKSNLQTLMAWKERFESPTQVSSSESDGNEADNDLLLTKKVVFLKENRKRRGRKKKIGWVNFNKNKNQGSDHTYSASEPVELKDNEDSKISEGELMTDTLLNKDFPEMKKKRGRPKKIIPDSTYVKNERNDTIYPNKESRIKKKRTPGRPKKYADSVPITQKLAKPKKLKIKEETQAMPSKGRRGKPKKIKNMEDDILLHKIKASFVELSPAKVSPEIVQRYINYYKEEPNSYEVIDTVKGLQNKIDPAKPLLIVNEMQCAQPNMRKLCYTNNVVFPVSEISEPPTSVVNSTEMQNVTFVRSGILCKYLSGVRETD